MGWVTGILIWDLDWMWRIVWVRVRDLLHLKFALILAFCLALFDESGRGRWIFVCYVYLGSRIVTLLPRLAFWNLQFKRRKLVNNIRVSIFASPKLHGSVHKYKRYAILVQILFLGSVTYLSGFQLLLLFWTWFESLTFIHPPKKILYFKKVKLSMLHLKWIFSLFWKPSLETFFAMFKPQADWSTVAFRWSI